MGLESSGRLVLPVAARATLGATGQATSVRGVCNRIALVLRPTGPGAGDGGARAGGVALGVDRRGRLCVPVWLRRASAGAGVVVGAHVAAALVVVAAVGVLDGLGDVLAGEPR